MPHLPFTKILRLRIPFVMVVIAKTKNAVSSTKVWLKTGSAINKFIMSGWNWSEVMATLTLHMDRNPDFRSVVYSIVIYVLAVISVYSVALATCSYYLGSRRKHCGSLRAEIVRLTKRLREADGRIHEADGRQVKAQAIIRYLLEKVGKESSSGAAADVAAAWAVAVHRKQGDAVVAGMEDSCLGRGIWATSGEDSTLGGVRVASTKKVGISCGHRFERGCLRVGRRNDTILAGMEGASIGEGSSVTCGADAVFGCVASPTRVAVGYGQLYTGEHRKAGRQKEATLAEMENAASILASAGTSAVVNNEEYILKHLPSPMTVSVGNTHRPGGELHKEDADAGRRLPRTKGRTVDKRFDKIVFSSCCSCCKEKVRDNLGGHHRLVDNRKTYSARSARAITTSGCKAWGIMRAIRGSPYFEWSALTAGWLCLVAFRVSTRFCVGNS